eukprot:3284306-Amphidinium_carterae.1
MLTPFATPHRHYSTDRAAHTHCISTHHCLLEVIQVVVLVLLLTVSLAGILNDGRDVGSKSGDVKWKQAQLNELNVGHLRLIPEI